VGVCLFVGLFSSSGVLVVLCILVCMIHHEGEKQASKQSSKWVITTCKWVELTVNAIGGDEETVCVGTSFEVTMTM
jgi:ABC-type Zn uptake system ZnuABC Zn-binding protein ZnuA